MYDRWNVWPHAGKLRVVWTASKSYMHTEHPTLPPLTSSSVKVVAGSASLVATSMLIVVFFFHSRKRMTIALHYIKKILLL
jgi:hypothetical protein